MPELNVHSVLVTGSNRGIGLELVRQLAGKTNCPEWIFATCRDPEGPGAQALKNLAAEHQGIEIIPLDTSEAFSVKTAAAIVTERLKGASLNLLINNAGIVNQSTLETATPEDMLKVYNTNVNGPMMVTQEFLPLLKKAAQESPQKGMSCSKAAIVNVTSECGSITNLLGWELAHILSYRCSKAALNMLTKCQSLGYAKDEILCIMLHPGWLQTDMGNQAMLAPMTVDEGVRKILDTLANLSEKDTGTFVDLDGKTLPW
ncbi:C-factor-like [Sceloporus undulatus]|uniref:C-factor-like n=1 Tax=Sceloporus undulatus TaxID=8520 RepID=UPI001C4B59FC|nr:C-factor-like [Sceloporus undulatus]